MKHNVSSAFRQGNDASSDKKSTLGPALWQRKCIAAYLSVAKYQSLKPQWKSRPCGPSNYTVLQQRLKVLVAGGGGTLFITAGEGCVDVDAGQRGHGVFTVWEGLVIEGQLRGRGRAGRFLWDEECNKKGHDHGTGAQQEGRPRDECSLKETEKGKGFVIHLVQKSSYFELC